MNWLRRGAALSIIGSFSYYAYSHSTFEGSPDRDPAFDNELEGLCPFYQILLLIEVIS